MVLRDKNPTVITRSYLGLLPPVEAVVRMLESDVLDLAVYEPMHPHDIVAMFGRDEAASTLELPVAYEDIYRSVEREGRIYSNGPALQDVTVLRESFEGTPLGELFWKVFKEAYSWCKYYEAYESRYTRLVQEFFTDRSEGRLWSGERFVGIDNRLVLFNLRLLERLIGDITGRLATFHIGPLVYSDPEQPEDRLLALLRWYRLKYPSLRWFLVSHQHCHRPDFAERLREHTGLTLARMRYRPSEGYALTSALGLLMEYGPEAGKQLSLESVRFEDESGRELELEGRHPEDRLGGEFKGIPRKEV